MRASPGTSEFKELQHNADLCPLVEDRVRHVAERYNFQSGVIYDVQGPQDEGADVMIRLAGSEGQEFVCFQVKSDRELTADKLDTLLRAQYVQAADAYHPMVRYYLLPFADVELGINRGKNWKDRREIVKRINGVFKRTANVLVVQPEMLKTFVELTDTRIDAFVKAVIGQDDFVLNECRQELAALPEDYSAIVANLCARFVADPAVSSEWDELASAANEVTSDGLFAAAHAIDKSSEELANFLWLLEDRVVTDTTTSVRLAPDGFPATVALMYDARVRFGYRGKALVDYLGYLL
jgi:hypothetical protein